MVVQIYSMTSIPDAVATAEAGADLIGVVVAEAAVLPEAIDPASASEILSAIRPRARGVALSLADDRDEICAMVDAVRRPPPSLRARNRTRGLRLHPRPYRAGQAAARDRRERGRDHGRSQAHQDCADFLMLDAGAKGFGREVHEWTLSRGVVARSRLPVILAGGLSADNVAQTIAAVRPWGVDSFTHTDFTDSAERRIWRGCAPLSPQRCEDLPQ